MTCRKGPLSNEGILKCGGQLAIWRHIDTNEFQAGAKECALFQFQRDAEVEANTKDNVENKGSRSRMELDRSRVLSTIWLER